MSNGNKQGQEFEQWEVEMVRKKARRLVGKYGFTESDRADLEQQLLIHIFTSRSIKKFSNALLLEWKEDTSRYLDNKIRKIKEHAMRDKRSVHLRKEALAESFEEDDGAEKAPWIVRESEVQKEIQLQTTGEDHGFSQPMEDALEKLTPLQRKIVQLRTNGYGIQEIAKKIRRDRTTVFRQMEDIRKIFEEFGFGK